MEIEKKYLVKRIPFDMEQFQFHVIEQGYLNIYPAIRVRREDNIYYMTYKGDKIAEDDNSIGRVEYNLMLDKSSYEHMLLKADGNIIRKKRYLIPINEDAFPEDFIKKRPEIEQKIRAGEVKIELDVFDEPFKGRIIAEVEFPNEEAAQRYNKAGWFDEEVTGDKRYSNANMSTEKI
ncbi:MAG: adenylate cyclase [Lachnospiraceae bacterium]|nr:adenylate cyclase [Lachnospiraceae bacterium]